jgi:uncharacterized protein
MVDRATTEPLVIEPRKFARERASASGLLRAGTLQRLAELLFDAAGEGGLQGGDGGRQGGTIEYRVTGCMTPKDEPALRLEVGGEIDLRCQRCLERLSFALNLRREIVLVSGADQFEQPADEEEFVDTIPALDRIDLRELVEEEILLALPMAPRHAPGECQLRPAEPVGPQGSASPFAVLARLKH